MWVVDDTLPFGDDNVETLPMMELMGNEIPAAVGAALKDEEKNTKNAANASALSEIPPSQPENLPEEVPTVEEPELPDLSSKGQQPVPDPTKQLVSFFLLRLELIFRLFPSN